MRPDVAAIDAEQRRLRRAIADAMTEREIQREITNAAETYGWNWYHANQPLRDRAGFPDLVLIRPPKLLICELKSKRGRVSPQQAEWIEDLTACGVDARIVRPDDLEAVLTILRGAA